MSSPNIKNESMYLALMLCDISSLRFMRSLFNPVLFDKCTHKNRCDCIKTEFEKITDFNIEIDLFRQKNLSNGQYDYYVSLFEKGTFAKMDIAPSHFVHFMAALIYTRSYEDLSLQGDLIQTFYFRNYSNALNNIYKSKFIIQKMWLFIAILSNINDECYLQKISQSVDTLTYLRFDMDEILKIKSPCERVIKMQLIMKKQIGVYIQNPKCRSNDFFIH